MQKRSFGFLPDGREAHLYTISCDSLTAAVTDFGATLVRLLVPDAHGTAEDVVLGYDDVLGYWSNSGCLGAPVGRCANRIGGAQFTLNGKTYTLAKNNGENNLHSGPDYWFKRLWTLQDSGEDFLTFALHSPDGDQGFPGNLDFTLTYRLTENALHLHYHGLCDEDTVLNPTNHSYFNLAGQARTDRALEQLLWLNADAFTPADPGSIPTGELSPVAGTPMDFRAEKAVGRDIGADYTPLHYQGGYDHNFVLLSSDGTRPAARLRDPGSGRTMEVFTDCPGVQLYTANYLNASGKDGVFYPKRSAVCLETQFFPDSVNRPNFPSCIQKAGVPFDSETVFAFSVLK